MAAGMGARRAAGTGACRAAGIPKRPQLIILTIYVYMSFLEIIASIFGELNGFVPSVWAGACMHLYY